MQQMEYLDEVTWFHIHNMRRAGLTDAQPNASWSLLSIDLLCWDGL